ncbi:unnamed protein product [Urochloa decumbens]|uniref:DUF1618 domain-containing protein n=1 Tax=Urochloa decumbens TaxID=240449 RepID=A0ABC9E7R4_9POAL
MHRLTSVQISGLRRYSRNPPAVSAAVEDKLPWVLLERDAYVAKRDNATTAFALTCHGKPIQVTFCACRPPRVSYVCVHCPDPDEINTEPTVLATEQGFVLLAVTVGREGDYTKNFDYYVYHADGAEGPSLVLLPRPPYPFRGNDAGVLCYHNDHTGGKEYIVVALCRDWSWPSGQFDLCLYDSNKSGHWNVHRVSLSKRRGRKKHFYHKNCKVVAVGGDAGTMAFADLWRGILFCDVLRVGDEAARRRPKEGEPMPCSGWMATTWSRPAAATSTSSSSSLSSLGEDDRWRQDTSIRDLNTGLMVPNNLGFELLSRRPWQPVLGLQDDADDIVYFTALVRCMDNKSCVAVAAVDMGKKELLGATAFSAAPRYIDFAYVHSTVSKYLRLPSDHRL